MKISRDEALKAVDDIFNYCEEIDNSLPENERSGYKMLPDIHKIRKYIIENTRPQGEWIKFTLEGGFLSSHKCSNCGFNGNQLWHFCPNCGASMRREGDSN